MGKIIRLFIIGLLFLHTSYAQELYVFSEPASNMPAHSVSAKITYRSPVSRTNNYYRQRYTPEIMFGLSRQWMLHVSGSLSDFYSPAVRGESAKLYTKYRFYSNDDVHRHFRMAAFAEAGYSRNPFVYGDINLDGDNSGVQAGFIATQLVNKLALSGTASVIKIFTGQTEHAAHAGHSLQALNYSLSAGYLLFPKDYTGYKQVNVNLYVETIGMKGFDGSDYMIDLAPALQFIFNSNFKINLGARFQAAGNMVRAGETNYYLGIERTFLGALQRRKKTL
jgi:hypothetical protein